MKMGNKDDKCGDVRVVKPRGTSADVFHAFPDTLGGITFARILNPKLTYRSSNGNFTNF